MTVTERDLRVHAQEIGAHIRALRRDLRCASADDIARSGLTGPVMKSPATVTELGRELGTGHSTVSGIVDRLQTRGLVQRVQDNADRRYTRISVTEKAVRATRGPDLGVHSAPG